MTCYAICDVCDDIMMLSVNQVRLYSVQYTHNINPIMNDECYYTAEKGLVRLHIVYNTHTRLNPMMNVQYTVYKIQCVQYTHNTMMNATTQLVNVWGEGRPSPSPWLNSHPPILANTLLILTNKKPIQAYF